MKFKKIRLFALTLSTSVALMASAQTKAAEPVGIDGALYLKDEIHKMLDQPNFGIKTSGEVEVEPTGNYYAVTLPHIRMDMPVMSTIEGGQDGVLAADFGISALNMVPTDKKGRFVFAQSIPMPWRFYSNDQEVYQLSIGKQKTNGIFDFPMQITTRIDSSYEDIQLKESATNKIIASIESITAKGGYDENKEKLGYYSGRIPIEIKGFKMLAGAEQPLVSIDTVKFYGGYTDMSAENMAKCIGTQRNFNKQVTSYVNTKQVIDPPVIAGYVDSLLSCLGIMADGMESGLVVEGVNINAALLGQPAGTIALNSLYTQSIARDIFQENMSMVLKFGLQNVQISPYPEMMSKYYPNSFHVDFGIDNVPHGKIYEVLRGLLGMYSQDAQSMMASPAMILMPILARLPQLFNEAQSQFTANDIRVSGKDYQLLLKGAIKADINSIYGVSGKGTLTFQNIDNFLNGVKAEAQDPDMANAANLAGIIGIIQSFYNFGKDDGNGNRTYDIEITQQGRVLMNGKDVMNSMAMQNPTSGEQPTP